MSDLRISGLKSQPAQEEECDWRSTQHMDGARSSKPFLASALLPWDTYFVGSVSNLLFVNNKCKSDRSNCVYRTLISQRAWSSGITLICAKRALAGMADFCARSPAEEKRMSYTHAGEIDDTNETEYQRKASRRD